MNGWEHDGPLNARTILAAVVIHLAVGLVIWSIAKAVFRKPEVLIPIDMTIVPPWAEVDPDDPEPDPNPPPPEEEVTPPPKAPEPEPPKIENDPKLDAVVKEKEPEKPRKPEVKPPEPKPEPPKPKKPEIKPGDFKKKSKLINTPLPPKQFGKGTAKEKPLSADEIRKALDAGAHYGASNQLAASEEQRCISLVAAALKRHWTDDFQWTENLQSVYLELSFAAGGRIRDARIVRSSGDAQVDRTVLQAARNTGSVPGLSAAFLSQYSVFTIEMKPTRR